MIAAAQHPTQLSIRPRPSRPRLARGSTIVVLSCSLVLSGCATTGAGGGTSSAFSNCAVGGVMGGLTAALIQRLGSKKKVTAGAVAGGVAAGCVVGIAYTAVGEHLNKSQQEKQERAFQAAARSGTRPGAPVPAAPTTPGPRNSPPARGTNAPATIGSAQWNEPGTSGGAAPAGPAVVSNGNQCVAVKEWANVNGRYVEQEVEACRPVADASREFQRVVPKA